MDVSTITKEYIRLQKQSLNNIFDTLALFQDHAEKTNKFWACQIGVNNNVQTAVDRYRAVLKQGHGDARKLVSESLTNIEAYFADID